MTTTAPRRQTDDGPADAAQATLVVDVGAISTRMRDLVTRSRVSGARLLHTVKSSAHPSILRAAHQAGLGFDVTNPVELERLLAVLPQPGFVSLTPTSLSSEDMAVVAARRQAGILDRMHLDSLDQLRRWVTVAEPGPVGLRLNMAPSAWPVDVPARRVSRFGLPERDLPAAVEVARSSGHEIAWLHLHNASEKNSEASFIEGLKLVMSCAAAIGPSVRGVNLGGGLPAVGAEAIASLLADLTTAAPDVDLTLEPGRWWSRNAVHLETSVLDVKVGDRCVFVVVSAGSELRRWSVPLLPAMGPHPDAPLLPYVVCGVTAYEQDFFGQVEPTTGAPVPKAGDELVMRGMSTYSLELATAFNGVGHNVRLVTT